MKICFKGARVPVSGLFLVAFDLAVGPAQDFSVMICLMNERYCFLLKLRVY